MSKDALALIHAPLTDEALKVVDRFIFPAINAIRKEFAEAADNKGCLRELDIVLNAAHEVPSLAKEVRAARSAAPSPLFLVEDAPKNDPLLEGLDALEKELAEKEPGATGDFEAWAAVQRRLQAYRVNAAPLLAMRLKEARAQLAAAALPPQYQQERSATELEGLPEGEYHLADLENRLYAPFGPSGLRLDDASLLDHVCQYARRLENNLRAATPVATAEPAGRVVTGEMVDAALASTTPGEGPYTLEETLDFSGADTARRVVRAALEAAFATPVATVGSEPLGPHWAQMLVGFSEPPHNKRVDIAFTSPDEPGKMLRTLAYWNGAQWINAGRAAGQDMDFYAVHYWLNVPEIPAVPEVDTLPIPPTDEAR